MKAATSPGTKLSMWPVILMSMLPTKLFILPTQSQLTMVLEVMAVPMFVLVEADQHGDPSHDGPGEYEEMIR